MQKDDIKEEIIKYVQALETNYTETFKELRSQLDKERLKSKKVVADKVNENTEKNELEGLFVDCIEEVRKDIMKRRLKNEIYNKKKFQQVDRNSDEAREFEESLLNEKTLLKIYEALFPHRAPGQGQSGDKNAIHPHKERQITLKNSQISNYLA